jgi:hypothetical protein
MSGIVVDDASLSLPLLGGTRDGAAIVADPQLAAPLRRTAGDARGECA